MNIHITNGISRQCRLDFSILAMSERLKLERYNHTTTRPLDWHDRSDWKANFLKHDI